MAARASTSTCGKRGMYLLDFYQQKGRKVRSVALEQSVTVGRSRESDVTLADRSVSRLHATFIVDSVEGRPRVVVRDEGSTNGILVNARTIRKEAAPVEPGDRIRIGIFRVELSAQAAGEVDDFEDRSRTIILDAATSTQVQVDVLPAERLRALYELSTGDERADAASITRAAAVALAESVPFERLVLLVEDADRSFHVVTWNADGPCRPVIEPADRPFIENSRTGTTALAALAGKRPQEVISLGTDLRVDAPVSVICLPVIGHSDRPFGSLLLHGGKRRYGSEDLRFLSLIARSVATQLERLLHERALVEARDAAEAASRAKSEFLANMSHELRTPLHAMLGFARFGLKRWEDAPRSKLLSYFREIAAGAERMVRVVGDLVDLADLQAGRATYSPRLRDVRPILHAIAAGFSERLADRSIRLEILAKGSETSCFCDAEALSRVISILLENAIRFAPTGSAISCTLNPTVIERDEELLRALEIAVADEGIGIPANELESIFDAFTQSSLTKDGSGGTGLGLTIARAIVTAHGGTIVAQNRAGGGATLRVTLPAEEEPSTNVEPTTEPSCASAPA